MVALLGVTGYLNIALNNAAVDAGTKGSTTNYFSEYVQTRAQTRQEEFLYYDAIINSELATAEEKANAQNKKLEIIDRMESELIMENLIRALGFEENIVTFSSTYINVIVKGNLERADVAKIVAVVQEQTGKDIDYIKITPV
jgi:stage III sporulation protein AH